MSDDERVCPRCGETKVWGEEFAECEDCDPVGASDDGTGPPEPGHAALRAALATSQADVTRLTAELSESVRALAVSQGDAKGWMKVYGKQIQTSAGLALKLSEAKALLALAVAAGRDGIGHIGAKNCEHCANLARCDAFLAPTASPEPDRASPEVTVKENDDAAK